MSNQTQQKMTILIAEDDDGHAELIRENLQESGVGNPIIRFVNGQAIWNFLSRSGPGPHRETKKAYLLLLDIRMPKMDGIEVLRRIKADPSLHSPCRSSCSPPPTTRTRWRNVTSWDAIRMSPSRSTILGAGINWGFKIAPKKGWVK